MKKVLVVDDEKLIVKGIKFSLEQDEMQVDCAYDGEEALEKAKANTYDIILLDVMLPGLSGFEVCQAIREFSNVPIIMLTAKGEDMDKILGLEYGADDYITKPFNVLILVQRVRAVLKRYHAGSRKRERVKTGNLEIDFQSWQVWKSGVELTLTPTEFRLLKKFCDNPGIVLTRRVLLETMWDKEENFVDEHTLTMFVSRLRSKISDEEHSYIRTVYGTGYQWMGK